MSIAVAFFDLGDTLVTSDRRWIPQAKALLHTLLGMGLRLGIISNTGNAIERTDILKLLPADFDLTLFDPILILFSSEVGMEKPDALMFREAVARTGLTAQRCLYCSENIVETLMAQEIGMRSVCVGPNGSIGLNQLAMQLSQFQTLVGGR